MAHLYLGRERYVMIFNLNIRMPRLDTVKDIIYLRGSGERHGKEDIFPMTRCFTHN